MTDEKLIEKTIEKLQEIVDYDVDSMLRSRHVSDSRAENILRAAFAEVRREAIEEALEIADAARSWDVLYNNLRTLLPPAAEEKAGTPMIPDCGFTGGGRAPCGEPVHHSGCHGWCDLEYNAHDGPCRAPTAAVTRGPEKRSQAGLLGSAENKPPLQRSAGRNDRWESTPISLERQSESPASWRGRYTEAKACGSCACRRRIHSCARCRKRNQSQHRGRKRDE